MKRPVMDALIKLVEEDSVSFHFPGHKGRLTNIDWAKLMPMIDTTETMGMDNLLEPHGIIAESQKEAAKVVGAKYTIYAVNGSTGSNYIALSAVTKRKDKILVQRNCHKSIYNSMILNDLIPVYLYPYYNTKYDLSSGINPEDVETALNEHPDIKAVVLTSPNYYGVCSDIEKIAKIVHERNKILIVDEAHGPHLVYTEKFPKSAIETGADIVIHSTHKTLPSLTQTSIIHVCSDRVDINKLMDRYQLYTTTSPSYLFTLSNEAGIAYMDDIGGKELDNSLPYLQSVIERLKAIDGVAVFEDDPDDPTIFDIDITKILFELQGYRGVELKQLLYTDYNIRMEMSDYYNVLAMSTVMNTKEDFERLIEAVADLASKEKREPVKEISLDMPKPTIAKSPADTYFGQKKLIDLKDSVGEIAATPIIPYPPGVPLLAAGEVMTQEVFDYLMFLIDNGINIVNLTDNGTKIVVAE